jgi:hypothetical protein
MRHQRTFMCVPDRLIGLTRNRVTDIGSLPTGRIVHRHRFMASTGRPTRPGRSTSTARPPIPSAPTRLSVTTPASATPRRNTTMNTRRGRRCPCLTARVHDATTATAGGPTAIKAGRTRDGWSASSAVAPRARAEAIPILSPRTRLTGFALALPILRTDLDQDAGWVERSNREKLRSGSENRWKPSPATCWSLAPARPG